jgi:hypothetical protein
MEWETLGGGLAPLDHQRKKGEVENPSERKKEQRCQEL